MIRKRKCSRIQSICAIIVSQFQKKRKRDLKMPVIQKKNKQKKEGMKKAVVFTAKAGTPMCDKKEKNVEGFCFRQVQKSLQTKQLQSKQ